MQAPRAPTECELDPVCWNDRFAETGSDLGCRNSHWSFAYAPMNDPLTLSSPCEPDWARHAKAAPFKRNDRMLETLPIGVIVFPGSGISANLADKARVLGIPVWRYESSGA